MDQSPPSAPAQVLLRLRRAYVARQSGHLHVTRGDERRGFAVREGHIVHARSGAAGEHLSDVLVRHGFVEEADRDRALATALAERRPLGTVLGELGLIDRARLEEAVGCHVREILFAALDQPDSSVVFEELETLPEDADSGDPASRLSTGRVLLEAARRLQDPAVVREALGDPDRKLVLANDPRLRVHPVALTPTDGFVLSRIDGTLSARELVGLIPLPPEDTEKSLLGLLCTGAVDFAPDHPAPRRAPAPPAVAPPEPAAAPPPAAPTASAPAAPTSAEPEAPPAAPPGPSPEDVRRLILEAHASLLQRDHFELLGVTPAATAVELRAGYARLARILHPDACRDAILTDVEEQREAVFLRVCRAYETLRDPETRAEYEADLRRRKPRPAPSDAPTVVFSAPFVPPPPSEAPTSPTGGPSPAGPVAPGPSLEERMEEAIAEGEELLRNGQPWEAIQKIEPTLQHAQGALRIRARLALARASMKNPEWLRKAESHLQDVLREDPMRLEAYLLLGDIYKTSQLRVRATAMYRKALDLQPGNRHALRELARLEGAGTPPAGTGSLLGFLKKR
jgi:tetratricopeptide (TPR) repeat protein